MSQRNRIGVAISQIACVVLLLLVGLTGWVWGQGDSAVEQAEWNAIWEMPTAEALKTLDRQLEQPERYPGFHRNVRMRKLGLLLDEDGDAALAAQEASKFIELAETAEERNIYRSYRVTALSVIEDWEEAISEQQRLIESSGPGRPRQEQANLADLLMKANQPQKSLDLWEQIRREDGRLPQGTAKDDVVGGMVDAFIALHRGQEALDLLAQNPPAKTGNVHLDQARQILYLRTRSRAFESLGRSAEASADRYAAENMGFKLYGDPGKALQGQHRNITRNLQQLSVWWLSIPILIVWGVFLGVGRKQRRQEGGTWGAYLGITLGMACLCLLPFIAVVCLAAWHVPLTENSFMVSVVGIISSVVYTAIFLKVPQLLISGKPVMELPELEDPETRSAVAELSGRLGIRTPKIRNVPPTVTLGGLHAQVSGLVASTVLIDLGVLHRLTTPERKSILAHELAHIRNHTIGAFACVCPLAMTVATIVFTDPDQFFLCLLWAVAFGLGLWKLLSRRFEFDCDRRAAELCGAAATASALEKVHAASPIRNDGWASLLTFATQTHPSRGQRLAALAERFPEEIRGEGVWSADQRRLQTRINWLVGFIWSGLLGVTACFQWPILGAALCCLLWIFPIVILQQAIRPEVKRQNERVRVKSSRLASWLSFGSLLLIGVLIAFALRANEVAKLLTLFGAKWALWAIIPLGILAIWAMRLSKRKVAASVLNENIQSALINQDWSLAASFYDQTPDVVKADFAASHNAAVALWMLGREPEAVAELRRTWEQFPQQLQTGLTLWGMFSELEDWGSAAAISDEFAQRAPGDPLAQSLKASALVRDGHIDEVRQMLSVPWAEEERFSELTVRARLRMEERDWESAEKLIGEANAIAPGHLRLRLLTAELELARGHLTQARQLLDAAEKQLNDAPLELVQKRLARLQERLSSAESPREFDSE